MHTHTHFLCFFLHTLPLPSLWILYTHLLPLPTIWEGIETALCSDSLFLRPLCRTGATPATPPHTHTHTAWQETAHHHIFDRRTGTLHILPLPTMHIATHASHTYTHWSLLYTPLGWGLPAMPHSPGKGRHYGPPPTHTQTPLPASSSQREGTLPCAFPTYALQDPFPPQCL